MKWIGLTGGIATGKSTVAKIIRDLGIPVLDADSFAKSAVVKGSTGLNQITQAFGPELIDKQGNLDRKKMSQIVFSDPAQLKKLEEIIHPLVREAVAKEKIRLEREGHEIAFYDVPLLFEKNMQDQFDATLLVYCDQAEQIKRIRDRDHLSDEQIKKRLSAQIPIQEKLKLSDYVIFNQDSIAELKKNVEQVLSSI